MRRATPQDDGPSFDPIAVTLAVWLGLLVGVGGLLRLTEATAAQVTINQAIQEGNGMVPGAAAGTPPPGANAVTFVE